MQQTASMQAHNSSRLAREAESPCLDCWVPFVISCFIEGHSLCRFAMQCSR